MPNDHQGQAETLIDLVVNVFALTDDEIHDLAESIYAGRIASITSAYTQVASTLKAPITKDWSPAESALEEQAQIALANAAQIAATYRAELTRQAQTILSEIDTKSATRDSLVKRLWTWAISRATWKSQVIANAECGAGADSGTGMAINDLRNGQLVAGVDPSTVQVVVMPATSYSDICKNYAGRTFTLDEYDILPDFPVHPNCVHEKIVISVPATKHLNLIPKHYPGGKGHNQLTHAHGDGGVPKFGSNAEAEAWASAKYPHITFDFKNMHPVHCQAILTELHVLTQEWPEVTGWMDFIGTGSSGKNPAQNRKAKAVFLGGDPNKPPPMMFADFMSVPTGIYIHPGYVLGKNTPDFSLRMSERGEFHPDSCNTIASQFTHEYGHMVRGWIEYVGGDRNFADGDMSRSGIGNVRATVKQWEKRWRAEGAEVSRYARQARVEADQTAEWFDRGDAEAWAEGFASHYYSRPKFQSEYTKQMGTLFRLMGHSGSWKHSGGISIDRRYADDPEEYQAAKDYLDQIARELGLEGQT